MRCCAHFADVLLHCCASTSQFTCRFVQVNTRTARGCRANKAHRVVGNSQRCSTAVEQHERVAGASQFLRHRASVLSSEVPMLLRLSHCTDLANIEPDSADMRSSLTLCKITVQRYL
jgi:hypothetical protein